MADRKPIPEWFQLVHKQIHPIPVDGLALSLLGFLYPGSMYEKLGAVLLIAGIHGYLHPLEERAAVRDSCGSH